MFKFGGWKASLNFGAPSRKREVYDNGPDLSSGGAYRSHREEFFGRNSLSEPPKKLTPSMVKLPPSNEAIKSSKSASDLTIQQNLPPELRKSSPDVSTDPRGGQSNNRGSSALYQNAKKKSVKDEKKESKDKKNAEKKRLAEQKKKEKEDKLRIQRDKKIAEQQAKDVKARKEKEKKKTQAPLPQATVAKPLVPKEPERAIEPQRSNPLARSQYSTNTLESSISRSSGPPPYTEEPRPPEKQPNKRDVTGNTSFGKPIENSSWDLISEHRNQMTRNPVASGSRSKQMVMDLQFSFDKAQAEDRNNSEV